MRYCLWLRTRREFSEYSQRQSQRASRCRDNTCARGRARSGAQAEEFSLLEGYVSGAFAVTVDGVPYDDMEDFYTVERQNLPARVARSGYDATWNVRLDAAIGFQDLWHDMIIYMSPLAGSGFQGQARVGENGYFALKVPARGRDHDYRVRANKRIGIVLTRGEETRRICYNFSAVEQQVPLHADTLPIALEHFETSITTYDCVEVQDAGLDVPQGNG